MTTLTMDMSSYEIECKAQTACRDEDSNPSTRSHLKVSMPADLILADAGNFIRKMRNIDAVFLMNKIDHAE